MTMPTHLQLHIAITIGITVSALLAYFGQELFALTLALPSNLVWVWESQLGREADE